MTYLLIGGAPSTGKTQTIFEIADHLISVLGYIPFVGTVPTIVPGSRTPDFICILQGINKSGVVRTVLINSPSDLPGNIYELKRWKNL